MTVPSLSLTRDELRQHVGKYLGYETTVGSFTTTESDDIERIVEAACRRVYFPADAGDGYVHEWSFLRPTIPIPLSIGQGDYPLPDWVADVSGEMTFTATDGRYLPVKLTSEGQILELRSLNIGSGVPRYAARKWTMHAGATQQSGEIMIYPAPDSAYTLNVQVNIIPEKLDATLEYHWGGAAHAELFKAACLAEAELFDQEEHGPHFQQFVRRLKASIALDNRSRPETLGYNGDSGPSNRRADGPVGTNYIYPDRRNRIVTYNGVRY